MPTLLPASSWEREDTWSGAIARDPAAAVLEADLQTLPDPFQDTEGELPLVLETLAIDDINIDGMCGVY